MNNSWRRILVGGIVFGITCLTAVGGYMFAGWRLLDAVYMVIITVFGVGYGEAKPLESAGLKIFTMGVIVAGCTSGIYVVGGFVQMIAEGEINRVLGTRRMSKGIEQLVNHAIICGYGRVGQMLAHDLAEARFPFVVIDSSESRVEQAQQEGMLAMLGNASEDGTLLAARISDAKVLATVLPDDSANVFITLTARDLNPDIEIIARAEALSTEKKLFRSGATKVVMPALIGATKMANMIVRPSAEDLLCEASGKSLLNEELKQIGMELSEIRLKAGSPLVGQTISSIETTAGRFVIVGIKKADGQLIREPGTEVRLSVDDTLLVLGAKSVLPQLTLRAKPTVTMFRGAAVG